MHKRWVTMRRGLIGWEGAYARSLSDLCVCVCVCVCLCVCASKSNDSSACNNSARHACGGREREVWRSRGREGGCEAEVERVGMGSAGRERDGKEVFINSGNMPR